MRRLSSLLKKNDLGFGVKFLFHCEKIRLFGPHLLPDEIHGEYGFIGIPAVFGRIFYQKKVPGIVMRIRSILEIELNGGVFCKSLIGCGNFC